MNRVANRYFVLITLMQFVPGVSPFPLYITLIPLTIILGATAIKEGYEDFLRHKSDAAMNNALVRKLDSVTGHIQSVKSKSVRVGDIIAVDRDTVCPADIVLLSVEHTGLSEGSSIAWVDTAALDGETRFKVRRVLMLDSFLEDVQEDEVVGYERLPELNIALTCEPPNTFIDSFSGRVDMMEGEDAAAAQLKRENLMLRGVVLRNTKRAWGVVVGAGPLTKLRLNQQLPEFKFSRLELALNRALAIVFAFQTVLCLVWAAFHVTTKELFWNNFQAGETYASEDDALAFVYSFLTWFILCSYMVPMNLYVIMEGGKFIGGRYIARDKSLFDELGRPARPNTTSIVEELGQVEYILSDKTGTLTDNEMRFIHCGLSSGVYTMSYQGENPVLLGPDNKTVLPSKNHAKPAADVHALLQIMTCCNELEVEMDDDGCLIYSGESPDEVALTDVASSLGYVLEERHPSKVSFKLDQSGKSISWKVLAILPFNSSRKRMGVVVKDESGAIKMLYKGADNVMFHILKKHNNTKLEKYVDDFSRLGLRTLVMASCALDPATFDRFKSAYGQALIAMQDKDEKIGQAFEMIEHHLVPVGCTGVEDKLSDGVGEALQSLIKATVQVAVLTGDKTETAMSICTSCGLFKKGGRVHVITTAEEESIRNDFERELEDNTIDDEERGQVSSEQALVISGECLRLCLDNPSLRKLLAQMMKKCYTTVGTRMTPMQKALITKLVKEEFGVVCLAIGDGGNDVSMIREADVGVGIFGKEGSQAVNCSDFAIHKFADLKTLMFVHGSITKSRISTTAKASIFTNMALNLPQVYFGVVSLYAGQSIEPSNVLFFFNIVISSWCLIAMACFGRKIDPNLLMVYPELYNPRESAFSLRDFATEMGLAAWTSTVGFLIVFSIGEVWIMSGKVGGMFVSGTLITSIVVMSILVSYSLRFHCFTAFHFIALFAGFVIYWFVTLGLSMFWGPNATDNGYTWTYVSQSAVFWLACAVGVVLSIIPQYLIKTWNSLFHPDRFQLVLESLTEKVGKVSELVAFDHAEDPTH